MNTQAPADVGPITLLTATNPNATVLMEPSSLVHPREPETFELAPYAWPLVAFGPAATCIFGAVSFALCIFIVLGSSLGLSFWAMLRFFTPITLVLGAYPAFCWAWKRISKRRRWGLRIELDAAPPCLSQGPYRSSDNQGYYRVLYRGKTMEEGPLGAGRLALKSYYYHFHPRKKASESITWLVLQSRTRKTPVWWFSFGCYLTEGAYNLPYETRKGAAHARDLAAQLQQSLALPKGYIPHHIAYANELTERRVLEQASPAAGSSGSLEP